MNDCNNYFLQSKIILQHIFNSNDKSVLEQKLNNFETMGDYLNQEWQALQEKGVDNKEIIIIKENVQKMKN